MSRTPESPVLSHARQTLARARSGVAAIRARLRGAEGRNLDASLADLEESFTDLERASDAVLPQCWSKFFARYDQLLALLRSFDKPSGERD